MADAEHWNTIYRTRATEDLGWYEPSPSTLDLVLGCSAPTDPVIDIGGGDSRMVDELLTVGYDDVTVLDLSAAALARSQRRLGADNEHALWVRADITEWEPPRTWALWHDRAVFHFFTDEGDRRRYAETAHRALDPGGHVVIAAFAPDGPDQCAGLPVERYDEDGLAEIFAPGFDLVEHTRLLGPTAGAGDRRPYVAVVMRRR